MQGRFSRVIPLILGTATAACPPPSIYVTTSQAVIINDTFTKQYDKIDGIVTLLGVFFNQEEALRTLVIAFSPYKLDCEQSIGCLGCYYCKRDYIRVYIDSESMHCIAKSSLIHELLHFFLEKADGNCDAFHKTQSIWGYGGTAMQIKDLFIEKQCSEN
jgi:hypothetical protein